MLKFDVRLVGLAALSVPGIFNAWNADVWGAGCVFAGNVIARLLNAP